jgi:hypothetical protein
MDIIDAVKAIRTLVKPQKKAAEACGYSAAHFCQLVNSALRGERISPKAERILIGYAKELDPQLASQINQD